jgi:Asp-tRNA(Asn)/Glu-tRNA(Gln) amidotransferase A subunit family amidase
VVRANEVDSDPEEWANAPIGFQITARRLEEEKVVDMLVQIQDALGLWLLAPILCMQVAE